MARISYRESTRFVQESDKSPWRFALATIPLAIVMIYFIVEAYLRPQKPFYNLPSGTTDDAVIRQAAQDSGSLVPLMDMVYVSCAFCVAWTMAASYFLGYLGARAKLISKYLEEAKSVLGNVVYEDRYWACEFRYYGYCSYTHPDPEEAKKGTVIRKQVRIYEPYTRELVPILYFPGKPYSGQGKEDLEYADLIFKQDRPREVFEGRLCLLWAIFTAVIPLYILHQMAIIDEAEFWAGLEDTYDNVNTGWLVYGLFMSVGVMLFGVGGTILCWFYRRWWIVSQGNLHVGDISMHGVEGVSGSESEAEHYHKMSYA